MAHAAPNDEQIGTFIAVTGEAASRDVAVTFIRGANGNVDQAINDFFDNPGKYLNQNNYDESAWSQDRQGEWSNENLPAFQIDYATNEQYPHSNAPTRPPSRISQNSSTKAIPGSPLTGQDETWGQESGVVGSTGAHFGPANQDKYYDNKAWAMTWTGASSTSEAYADPIPAKRKRKPSQPATLKPLGNGDYLPSLITILHSISLGRYALGLDGEAVGDFRYDKNWWRGEPSEAGGLARVVSLDVSEEPIDHGKEFLEETQRLMAFLDLTTRSYASAGILAQSKVLEESNFSGLAKTYCDRFLLAWEAHASRLFPNLMPEMCIFRSQAVSRVSPRTNPVTNPFCTLLLTLSNGGSAEPSTLYDELDETIWSGDLEGKSEVEQSIMQAAPILCIRVEQPDSSATGLNFQVPLSWYADRYLHENEQQAKRMRQDTAQQRMSLQQIDELRSQTTGFTTSSGKSVNVQEMLRIAKAAYDVPPSLAIDDEGEPEITIETAATRYSLTVPEPRRDAIEKLDAISTSIERKLERLEQEKGKIKAAIEFGRSFLKERTDDPHQKQPTERYNLCGFATDARTTYILRRAKEQLIEVNSTEPEEDQWWRLHYPSGDDPKIEKEKVAEADIAKLASSSTRDVLLVYAVDKALGEVDISWPDALQNFIRADNEAFSAEIATAEVASFAELPGAAGDDAPDLVTWPQPDEPPAYGSADGGSLQQGFTPDDGKLSDTDYAKQTMANNRARGESELLSVGSNLHTGAETKGRDESMIDDIDLAAAEAAQRRVQHLEFADHQGVS